MLHTATLEGTPMKHYKLAVALALLVIANIAVAESDIYLICKPVSARFCQAPETGCDDFIDARRLPEFKSFALRKKDDLWEYIGESSVSKLKEFRADGSGVEDEIYSFEVVRDMQEEFWALSRRTGQLVTYPHGFNFDSSKPVLESNYQCKKEELKF